MKAKLLNKSGKVLIFETESNIDIPDGDLDIEIKRYKEKRSLDANAYAWHLMQQIAKALKTDKDSIYEKMLQRYGTPCIDEDGISIKISVLSSIDMSKTIKHLKVIGSGTVGNKEFTHYIVLKGSSEYNTFEMSQFIDGIIEDCKELGIDTATPDEVAHMMELFEKRR